MKNLTFTILCASFVFSPITWASGFPEAGVDNAPSLAKFKITFTPKFAVYLRDNKGAPFCSGYTASNCPPSAREYTSPMLYEPNTKIGRSNPHRDGDKTDEQWGADICGQVNSGECEFLWDPPNGPVVDGHFQWKKSGYQNDGASFDEGPTNREEIHTQILSFKITPLDGGDRSANAVRAGTQAPCQARSLGEVESLNGNGFPAESFFHMYVDVDVDMNNDGQVDMVFFNQAGQDNTIFGGDPLIIEATNLTSFPPKVIYNHTGRTGDKAAPKLYVGLPNRAKAGETKNHCGRDTNSAFYAGDQTHVGWIRIATHGIDFDPLKTKSASKKNDKTTRSGAPESQCMAGENDLDCFERVFNSLPMLPVPKEEDPPLLVELERVFAVAAAQKVILSWTTLSEIDNAGFHLFRAKVANADDSVEYTLPDGTRLTDIQKITSTLIPTQGVSHYGKSYKYIDSDVSPENTYYYALGDVDFKGNINIHFNHIVSAAVK